MGFFGDQDTNKLTFHVTANTDLRFNLKSDFSKRNFVSYEMSTDRTTVKRKIYGFLDYIGSLGGLAGALSSACRFVILLLQFRALHQYLTPHLFAISTEVRKED